MSVVNCDPLSVITPLGAPYMRITLYSSIFAMLVLVAARSGKSKIYLLKQSNNDMLYTYREVDRGRGPTISILTISQG